MKIFLVMGNTGEYSDFREWIVCAYKDEDKAKARVHELSHLLMVNRANSSTSYDERESAAKKIQEAENGDPQCDIDYSGADYHYAETELIE